jgi:uncharacterized membrane protein
MLKRQWQWSAIGFYLEILGLALWVGGLLVIIGVVIPAIFNSSINMEPAGRFLRRVFDGFGLMTVGVLTALLFIAGIRYWRFGFDSSSLFSVSRFEWILLGAMVLVTASILGFLGPKAVALQELAFEAVSKEDKDIAYSEFFRLHMIVRGLHMVNLGLAATLFILKLRKAVFGNPFHESPSGDSARTISRAEGGVR